MSNGNLNIFWLISIIASIFVIVVGLWYISAPSDFIQSRPNGKLVLALYETRNITDEDHILNDNVDADVFIIEYADIYCPACNEMRKTIKDVIKENGEKVGWVFRNFPLSIHHPLAYYPAVVGECVSQYGGNSSYWKYIDKLFELEEKSNITKNIVKEEGLKNGIPSNVFSKCVEDEKNKNIVLSERLEAYSAGAIGTPFIIIANKKGETRVIRGGLTSKKKILQYVNELL